MGSTARYMTTPPLTTYLPSYPTVPTTFFTTTSIPPDTYCYQNCGPGYATSSFHTSSSTSSCITASFSYSGKATPLQNALIGLGITCGLFISSTLAFLIRILYLKLRRKNVSGMSLHIDPRQQYMGSRRDRQARREKSDERGVYNNGASNESRRHRSKRHRHSRRERYPVPLDLGGGYGQDGNPIYFQPANGQTHPVIPQAFLHPQQPQQAAMRHQTRLDEESTVSPSEVSTREDSREGRHHHSARRHHSKTSSSPSRGRSRRK